MAHTKSKGSRSLLLVIFQCKIYILQMQSEQYADHRWRSRETVAAASWNADARENRLALRRQQYADRREVEIFILRRVRIPALNANAFRQEPAWWQRRFWHHFYLMNIANKTLGICTDSTFNFLGHDSIRSRLELKYHYLRTSNMWSHNIVIMWSRDIIWSLPA